MNLFTFLPFLSCSNVFGMETVVSSLPDSHLQLEASSEKLREYARRIESHKPADKSSVNIAEDFSIEQKDLSSKGIKAKDLHFSRSKGHKEHNRLTAIEDLGRRVSVVHVHDTNTTAVNTSGVIGSSYTLIDGASFIWTTGDWSDCSVECGTGTITRQVACFNNDTKSVVDDGFCLSDTMSGSRPMMTDNCQGPCVTCADHINLFKATGRLPPTEHPVPTKSANLCFVQEPKWTCCDTPVEQSIITQTAAIMHSFISIPNIASNAMTTAIQGIFNQTVEYEARITETSSSLEIVNNAIAATKGLKTNPGTMRALKIVQGVLEQRLSDLEFASSNASVILNSLQSQLDVLINDTSLGSAGTAAGSVAAGGSFFAPKLAQCLNASVTLFGSLACASCNPAFVTTHMGELNANGTYNDVSVSADVCNSLSVNCGPTIRKSREYLRSAMTIMRKMQINLVTASARLQPALLEVWNSLSFKWLPSGSLASAQVAPDIASLDCISNSHEYVLDPVSSPNQFCSAYFSNWNSQTTVNGITKDVSKGVDLMKNLGKCDLCFHTILSKLSSILSSNKGGIDVALALSPASLSSTACAGLSTSSSQSSSITASKLNFFAMSDGDAWTAGERKLMERKSKRGLMLILAAAKSRKSRDSITPVLIPSIQYTDNGIVPLSMSNVSWAILTNATNIPPPVQWTVRSSSEVGLIVWDVNCTSHQSCNPLSGDTPYWFCAGPQACNGTVPCDPNEIDLLNQHPKCVKGLCVEGSQGFDGTCPDIAVCPKTSTGQFDHFYFSKFRSIAPQVPSSSVTPTSSFTDGVCDCAFSKTTDAKGVASLVVADKCMFAMCVAYAQLLETSVACESSLKAACLAAQDSCSGLNCTLLGAQWHVPQCPTKGFALSAASQSFSLSIRGLISAATLFALALSLLL